MKKNHNFSVWLIILSCCLLISSCCDTKDEPKHPVKSHIVRAVVLNESTDNIHDSVRFYVFDEDNRLKYALSGKVGEDVELLTLPESKITVVCIGFSNNIKEPTISSGANIRNLSLTTYQIINGEIPSSFGDLFWGMIQLDSRDNGSSNAVLIKRRVASLSIVTKNLLSGIPPVGESFYYVVRQVYGSVGFNGEYSNTKISYKPGTEYNAATQQLTAQAFYILPADKLDDLYIDIYRGGTLIKTYIFDRTTYPDILSEGALTNLEIVYEEGGDGGNFNVTCIIKAWQNIYQSNEF